MPKPKKVPRAIQKAMDGGGIKIPQIAELVSHFMTVAGGPKVMAKMMMEEFLNAKSGSIIRQRILDSVLRMLALANANYATVDETDQMTQADIEAELLALMKEVPTDGPEEEVHPTA